MLNYQVYVRLSNIFNYFVGEERTPTLGLWGGQIHDSQQQTDDINSSLFIGILIAWGSRTSHTMQGQGYIQVESEQAETVGARLCNNKTRRCPLVLVVGNVWLF